MNEKTVGGNPLYDHPRDYYKIPKFLAEITTNTGIRSMKKLNNLKHLITQSK